MRIGIFMRAISSRPTIFSWLSLSPEMRRRFRFVMGAKDEISI